MAHNLFREENYQMLSLQNNMKHFIDLIILNLPVGERHIHFSVQLNRMKLGNYYTHISKIHAPKSSELLQMKKK